MSIELLCRFMRKFVHDAFISIAFWQIILTPYLLLYLDLGWEGYGKWCLANMPIATLAGPLFVRLYAWITE